jgi:hypothetical protein
MKARRISPALANRIRADAGNHCGYCLAPQALIPAPLEIEHIVPRANGGTDEEDNLWLACRLCNLHKGEKIDGRDPLTGDRVRLFDPRRQPWQEHFRWSEDGAFIIGLTACGRATAESLRLNNMFAVTARQNWKVAGWHPPKIEE